MSYEKEKENWHNLSAAEETKLNALLSGGCIADCKLFLYKDTKFAISENYFRVADKIRNFAARSDDVWIMTYPKSGTNWTSEIVWQIEHGLKTDFDGQNIFRRVPFFEQDMTLFDINGRGLLPKHNIPVNKFWDILNEMEGRRIIKSHVPFCLRRHDFLDVAKVIYVARHPKDVCVSLFHFMEQLPQYFGRIKQGFEEFAGCFIEGLIPHGDYWFHINQAYEQRHHPNLLFIWYEDLKTDLKGTISKISKFMGNDLDERRVSQLAEMVEVKNAKKNPLMNPLVNGKPFIRNGESGAWKQYFKDDNLLERFDSWMAESISRYGIDDNILQ